MSVKRAEDSCIFAGNHEKNVKKRKTAEEPSDDLYFKSYGDLGIHQEMLADRVRTSTYRLAILRNYEDIRGKVVIDVGAGTGILSMFCVHAGARKVYAIEASSMAEHAENLIRKNGMNSHITVIRQRVEDVEIPEKADVIVSEWMGYMLLYETMLPSVLFARDHWLQPNGIMLPCSASIRMAPISDPEVYEQNHSFWDDASSWYKLDLTPLKEVSQQCLTQRISVNTVHPEQVQSHATQICHLDLKTISVNDLKSVVGDFCFKCFGRAIIHGFAVWFDVQFPRDVRLTTSPYDKETHWSQSIMYLKQPIEAEQDTTISGNISLSQHKTYHRFLEATLRYRVDDGESKTLQYTMDDLPS